MKEDAYFFIYEIIVWCKITEIQVMRNGCCSIVSYSIVFSFPTFLFFSYIYSFKNVHYSLAWKASSDVYFFIIIIIFNLV